jgi:hypothetical protein
MMDEIATWTSTDIIFAPGTSFEQWREVFEQISATHKSINWLLGSVLLVGENFEGFSQVMDEKFIEQHREKIWVCRKIAPERRRDPDVLSWSVHRETASLDDEQQEYWLSRAEEGKWTTKKIAYEIGLAKAAKERENGTWPANNGAAVAAVVMPAKSNGKIPEVQEEPGSNEPSCPACGSYDLVDGFTACNDCGWSSADSLTTSTEVDVALIRDLIEDIRKDGDSVYLAERLDLALNIPRVRSPLTDFEDALRIRSPGWRISISEEDNGSWRVMLKKPSLQNAFGINASLPRAIVEAVLSAKIIELQA